MDLGKWRIIVNSFTTIKFLYKILYVTGSFYFSFLLVVNTINIYIFCRNVVNDSFSISSVS